MSDLVAAGPPGDIPQRLANKITGLLVLSFIVSVVAIGLTLLVSWQLEGSAAAINDAGSQRMRSYRLGYLMARSAAEDISAHSAAIEIGGEIERFEQVLRDLEQGDPMRPLAPPRDPEVLSSIQAIRADWLQIGRPILDDYLQATDRTHRFLAVSRYEQWIPGFVHDIDRLVQRMERNYAFSANLQRMFQIALLALALLGTIILIRFFFVLVIRPLDRLYDGIKRMAGDDFSVRLAIETRDEFGLVTRGFNRMAEHLQKLYATLEERVAAKTSSLEARNLELGLLYEVAAFLNEPASIETLCSGFIKRVKAAARADGATVRLCSAGGDDLFLVAQEGMSAEFRACEHVIHRGQCVCGKVLDTATPIVIRPQRPPPEMSLGTCTRDGQQTTAVFTISHNKRMCGVFNLFFREPRELTRPEICLLETLGQHLGVAVENQRLRSRERELAISEERNLLAQELHDSIAQGLAFLNIQVQLLQDSLDKERPEEFQATVDQIREGVQESYEDIRELLVHFRTRVNQTDLDSAIRASLDRFESQTGIATAFAIHGSGTPLPPDSLVQVMHIIQESLSNIRKHAMASQVRVVVERDERGTLVEVRDDGVGFDPVVPSDQSGRHVGLKIMQERAGRVGARCSIESKPGEGTRVVLAI